MTQRIQQKNQTLQCMVCTQIYERKSFIKINQCQHLFCKTCSLQFAKQCIDKQKPICCLFGCGSKFQPQSQLFELLSSHEKAKFQKAEFKRKCIEKGWKICPNQECQNGILLKSSKIRQKNILKCNSCLKKYCSLCEFPRHKGYCIQQNKNFLQNILMYAKCPKCSQIIQLGQGCIHMTCICSHQFCYRCLDVWSDGHQCHYKNKRKIKISIIDELNSQNNIKLQQDQFAKWLQSQTQYRLNKIIQKQQEEKRNIQLKLKLKAIVQLKFIRQVQNNNIVKQIQRKITKIKTKNTQTMNRLLEYQSKLQQRVKNIARS